MCLGTAKGRVANMIPPEAGLLKALGGVGGILAFG